MSRYLLCFCGSGDVEQFPSKPVGVKWLSKDVVVRVFEFDPNEGECVVQFGAMDDDQIVATLEHRAAEDEFCKIMLKLMQSDMRGVTEHQELIQWCKDRFEYTGGEYIPETVELYEKLNRWGLVSTPVGMLNPDFQYHHRVVLGGWDLRLEAIHKSSLPLNNMKEFVYHNTPIYSLYEIPEDTHPVLVAWYRMLSCETQERRSKIHRQLYLELLKALFEYQSSL